MGSLAGTPRSLCPESAHFEILALASRETQIVCNHTRRDRQPVPLQQLFIVPTDLLFWACLKSLDPGLTAVRKGTAASRRPRRWPREPTMM
jgi:hypothetical protein